MTWRDQLRPASFRGVAFFVRDHQVSGGRRGELHEYPGRDEPFAEDLGLKSRQYRVEAYVLGDDYMAARDALLKALESPGPGALVHPYLGTLQVAVIGTGYSMREDKDRGRFASFSIAFVQAGENRFPQATADTRALTRTQATASIAATTQAFEATFETGKKPAFIQEAAANLLVQAAGDIDGLARRLVALPEAAPNFVKDLSALRTSANSLVLTPANLASRVTGLVASLSSLGSDPLPAVRSLRDLSIFGGGLAPVPIGTANRSVQASNRLALTGLVRRAATIEAARSSADLEFESRDDALALRNDLAARLDTQILAAGDEGDDAVYGVLKDLLSAVVRDLTVRGTALPGLTSVTPAATLPALVLAHNVAGDDPSAVIGQADDIVARNKVRHPGFVTGGREIEVLVP